METSQLQLSDRTAEATNFRKRQQHILQVSQLTKGSLLQKVQYQYQCWFDSWRLNTEADQMCALLIRQKLIKTDKSQGLSQTSFWNS